MVKQKTNREVAKTTLVVTASAIVFILTVVWFLIFVNYTQNFMQVIIPLIILSILIIIMGLFLAFIIIILHQKNENQTVIRRSK